MPKDGMVTSYINKLAVGLGNDHEAVKRLRDSMEALGSVDEKTLFSYIDKFATGLDRRELIRWKLRLAELHENARRLGYRYIPPTEREGGIYLTYEEQRANQLAWRLLNED